MKAFGAGFAVGTAVLVVVKVLHHLFPTWWPVPVAALLYLVLGLVIRLVTGPRKRG